MTAKHSLQTETEGIHQPFNWVWANSTERLAQTVVATDVNKLGFQESDASAWVLTDSTPTWSLIGGGSAAIPSAISEGDSFVAVSDTGTGSITAEVDSVGIFTLTATGITLTSGVEVSAILDEDTLTSDSDTAVPTQQSVKAYVDAKADLTVANTNVTVTDAGTGTIDFFVDGASVGDITASGMQLGGSGARVTTVLDEDDLTTDSATALATQQSIKAYVDAKADLTVLNTNITVTDTGTGTIDFYVDGASVGDITASGLGLGGSGARVTTVLDEDDMATDSATALVTQQSVRAFVTANILPVAGVTFSPDAMGAAYGSPTLGGGGSTGVGYRYWALDASTDSGVAGQNLWWQPREDYIVGVFCCMDSATTGDVVLAVGLRKIEDTSGDLITDSATFSDSQIVTVPGTAKEVFLVEFTPGAFPPLTTNTAFARLIIERLGTDGDDDAAGDLWVLCAFIQPI